MNLAIKFIIKVNLIKYKMSIKLVTILILSVLCIQQLNAKSVKSQENGRITFSRNFITTTLTNSWSEQFSTRLNFFDEGKGGVVQVGSFTNGMTRIGVRTILNGVEQANMQLSNNQMISFYIPYGSSDRTFSIQMYCSSTNSGGSCGTAFVQIRN
jgi:hypothetical protein